MQKYPERKDNSPLNPGIIKAKNFDSVAQELNALHPSILDGCTWSNKTRTIYTTGLSQTSKGSVSLALAGHLK
jgi:hypothetical protein